MPKPGHLDWLVDTGERQNTACGREIEIWELNPQENEAVLSAWAAHFRQHYISDEDLPIMVDGTGLTNAEYLRQTLLPDRTQIPGPSLRSGDFGEILVADYIEYVLGYWCPRELRYQERWNRNDSTKGCDVIGFKLVADGHVSPNDELFIFETKSGMSASANNRLQDAIKDSDKDKLREAMSLNAIKQKFVRRGAIDDADRVKRFQDMADRPFRRINGAAAILDDDVFGQTDLTVTDASAHHNAANIRLIVIKGPSMMTLIHALYERAADEA
ncbi:Hachiman antiphage defense system protein HamA [Enterovirga sp. GCM10030262]|uniref:Hachiman antiphage defense system protein HamA n=1 Tax=Enterovirga sp. GCM10030262 TaxID=3273391 RepID=UPI0036220308